MTATSARSAPAGIPFARWPRGAVMAVSLGLVAVVGFADYATGHEILFSSFYLLAVGLAAWLVGRAFAVVVAVLSVAAWVAGDFAAGAGYPSPFVPVWNAAIILAFYRVVVALITRLRAANQRVVYMKQKRSLSVHREASGEGVLGWVEAALDAILTARVSHDRSSTPGRDSL